MYPEYYDEDYDVMQQFGLARRVEALERTNRQQDRRISNLERRVRHLERALHRSDADFDFED